MASGRPWAVFLDEIGPASTGVKPDADDPDHDGVRRHALWTPLMRGGSGAEWLFGMRYPHNDINLEDFRSRDRMWDQTRWALEFFKQVPVRETRPCPELVSTSEALCLARPGAVYAVYLGNGGTCSLTLEPGRYSVEWFDPRAGGGLQKGQSRKSRGRGLERWGRHRRTRIETGRSSSDGSIRNARTPRASPAARAGAGDRAQGYFEGTIAGWKSSIGCETDLCYDFSSCQGSRSPSYR